MRNIILSAICFLSLSYAVAQNIGINPTGSLPDNSAGLDIDFTNKGLLVPRLALTSATDAVTISSPQTSLLVYNIGTGGLSPAGYYYNAGTPGSPNWVQLLNGGAPGTAWMLLGNTGTTPGTHFLGTIDAKDLIFKTNNTEKMRITSRGNVGINTAAPGTTYLNVTSNNSATDAIRAFHTGGSTGAAFYAVSGNVNNAAYSQATGYLGYHNSFNKTFGVYGLNGDLAGMFNGKVGINTVSTDITSYDLEIRNAAVANPSNVILRQTTSNTAIGSILGNLDFGDNYNQNAQARIQTNRDAASSSAADLPTAITFWTTNDGTSTLTEKMRISNNGNVGIGTSAPNASALLHVAATNKGVMFPKVALTSGTDNITVPVSSPADDGMFVYNTNTAGTGTNAISPGYYYWQTNRWYKIQTSGYSGIVFGTHYATTPNNITTAPPTYQYTNAYIDLPQGKWLVYLYELVSPEYLGAQGWNSGSNSWQQALWVRCSLSNSNVAFSSSPDIIGSPLASGNCVGPAMFGMVTGAIYIYNSSGSTKRYYLWANVDRFGSATSVNALNFATTFWGENQFFAVPAE